MDTKHTGRLWVALFLAGAASSASVACSGNTGGGGNGSSSGAASSGSGSGSSGSSSGGGGSRVQGLFLDGITSGGTVVYDAQGGLHVAGNGSNGLRYGECSSQCAQAANWAYTDVVLAAAVNLGAANNDSGYGLAVDGEGRPRMMIAPWPNSNPGAGQAPTKYLECNANCASASNWTVTDLTGLSGLASTTRPADGLHFFAVAPQGGAAFAYSDKRGVVYKSCASGCASAANWQETVVTATGADSFSLAFDAAGNPHLTFGLQGAPVGGFGYAVCRGDCTSTSGWAGTTVGSGGNGMLAIDAQGRPTVLSSQMGQAGYYWCDGNCAASAASWGFVPTARLSWAAVSAQNNLRAAASGHYLACTAGCTSASPTWQDTPIPISDLAAADPNEPFGDQWQASGTMTLSLDLAGGAAITMDATRGNPWPPDKYGVFLWLVPAVADSAGGASGSSSGGRSSSGSTSGSSSGAGGSGSSSGAGGSSGMSDAGSSGLSNFEGAPWTGMLMETLSCGDAGTATSKPSESVTLQPTASGFAYTDQNGCTFDFTVSGSTATLSNAPVTCTVSTDAGSAELQYTSVTLTSADGHHLTVDVQGSVISGSLSCSVAESGTLTR